MGNKSNQVKEKSQKSLPAAHRQITFGSEVTTPNVCLLFSHLPDAAGRDCCHLVVTRQIPLKNLQI